MHQSFFFHLFVFIILINTNVATFITSSCFQSIWNVDNNFINLDVDSNLSEESVSNIVKAKTPIQTKSVSNDSDESAPSKHIFLSTLKIRIPSN